MSSDYHKKITNIIAEYGTKLNNISDVYKEKQKPIGIYHPSPQAQQIPIYYEPDVYYIKNRNNKYVIFEIADEQSESDTISDIIESYLCPFPISSLFFITPTKYKYKKHDKASKIILAILQKKLKIQKLPIPVRVIKIPKYKRYVKKSIFKILDKEVKGIM